MNRAGSHRSSAGSRRCAPARRIDCMSWSMTSLRSWWLAMRLAGHGPAVSPSKGRNGPGRPQRPDRRNSGSPPERLRYSFRCGIAIIGPYRYLMKNFSLRLGFSSVLNPMPPRCSSWPQDSPNCSCSRWTSAGCSNCSRANRATTGAPASVPPEHPLHREVACTDQVDFRGSFACTAARWWNCSNNKPSRFPDW